MSIEFACLASLVRDAEVKTSKTGKQYLRFNIRTGDGDAAQFINTMVFDAEAIAAVDQLKKGSRVYIEGRLSLDKWTAQDGSERHGLSATAWHCRLSQIGRNRPPKREKAAQSFPRDMHAPFNDDVPFAPEVR